MTTWLANRYSNLSTFNAVAINYSTLTGTTITVTSTMVSLGASTNKVYTTLSQGNFTSTSNWVTSLTGRTSTIGVSMSANALTQLVVSQSSSTTSIQYTSTLGASWSTLSNASGLPSSLTTSYSAGAISGDGKYGVLGTTNGQLFVTANAGTSWTNSGTIWTNTIPYAPVVYLPFENSLNDISGNGKNGVATGNITYVPGIVGKNAVYIQNTPGAAVPTSYIRGVANSWTVPTRFTISFWFNAPILNGTIQILFCALTLGIQIYIQTNNTVVIAVPSGTSTNYVNISSSSVISANTWYYVTLLYQANGTSSFYLNNQLMGTATSTGLGTHPQSNIYSLGSYDAAVSGGFNGYIDDLKIYNNMVTYSAPVLANFSNVAISNSGQYMLASATGAGLYLSSDYGSTTFAPVTGAMLSALWTAAQISASGQYMLANSPVVMVQPQLTGLIANTWQVNGITWTASISSIFSTIGPVYYTIFNNVNGGTNGYPTNTVYSAANPGLYTGSISTSIVGQAALLGEYFQVQSSVPLQMYSYRLNAAGYWQFPNTYTIVGSNDGSTWYLLQSVTMNQNPCGTTVAGNYAVSSTNIIINQSGTQTMTTFNFSTTTSISSAILTCTASAYSANAYTYFRLIVPTIWNNQTPYVATQAALGQWIINFQAGGQTYSTNYGLTWNNGYALYSGQTQLPSYSQPTISPQLTGLAASTWQTNGITWTVSASDINPGTYSPYLAFNNVSSANNTFATPATYNTTSGAYTGSQSTNIQGTSYPGEWLQLQSSVPLIMFSYSTAMGGSPTPGNQAPDTYQIVGSNDGSTWYTIQTASRATGNPYGAIYGGTSTILVNNPGTITVTGTSGTPSATYTIVTTSYTTTPFLYFRMCVNKIIPTLFGSLELGEWYINFRLPSLTNATTTYSSTTLSLSESGQYALSTTISNPVLLAELNFEGSAPAAYADSVGGLTYIGTYFSIGTIGISTVQKVVGSSSLLIAGITAGQAGSNSYVSYSLPPSFATLGNLFSISAWIRPTALAGNSVPFSLGAGPSATMIDMYILSSGIVNIEFFTTSAPGPVITFSSITTISINTWSHIACVVGNGIIYLYVNGSLQNTQSYTGALCVQNVATPAPYFYVGCGVGVYNQFVGYIDNLRIYNSALTPQQIQAIYANNVSSTTLTQLVPSFSVSPQQTGLASNTWSQGGVAWTVSTSSILAGLYYPYYLFDNTNYTRWVAVSITYTTSGNSSGIFTTILGGIGSIQGDWVQLQTSVPLVMSSYQFANGYANQRLPKTYYIIGSNDGTNWYPVQYGSGGTVPAIDQYTLIPSTIIVNSSSTQTFGSGSIVTTIYPTTTTAYLYFRLVCVTNYSSSGDYIDIGGWFLTFTGPSNTSLYNVISPLTNFSTGSSVSTGTIPGVITGSAVSTTGQYMVVVTNNTSGNNVYYSTNTGATFTGLQLGSSPMTSVAISYDGSYITVSNATTVYQLNNNSSGYSVAVGNQAGAVNQYQNAIAIGNYAGTYYQYSNSIILNATGQPLNSANQGFYVAPIAQYTASSSSTFSLLGYGTTDNQIVQSGVTFSSAQQTIYGEWIQYQLTTPVSITSYVLQPRGSFPDRYPVAWTLVGSADGVNWTILDSQSGKTSTLWGVSYLLPTASPVYSFIRIIFTQVNNISVVNGNGYVDIAGFILYSSGGPIFGSYTGYTTLAAGMYNILLYNSLPVCTITFSRPNTNVLNSFGIAAGATSDASFPPAMMPTLNGYTISTTFLSMYYALTGSTLEYSPPNYIATRGTSTVVTAPLIQTQDLTGNTKHQSSSLISLDVNGTTRTQQLQFLDGSIQNTANQFQPAWGSFGQLFTWSPMPLSIATQTNVAISASGQYISIVNTIDNASTISISSTYGQSWTTIAVNTKGLGSNKMECVNVSGTGQYQLASCSNIGLVYGSSTYGQTWAPVYTGSIIMQSPGLSYTGQYQTIVPLSGSSNVLISSTYGQSWTPINIGTAAAFAGNVGISYSGQYQVLAVQSGTPGIYTSSTYGQTWSLAYSGSAGWNYVAISSSGQYQIATIYNGPVYLSINYGQSFAATSLATGNWRGCAISSTGQYMACTNDATIAYSTTYGQSWSATTVRATSAFYGIGMSASGQYMIAGGSLIAGGVSAYLSVVPSYSPGTVVIGSGTIATPLGMTLLASTSGFGGYDFKCSTTFTAVAFNSIVDGGNVGFEYIYHDVNVNNGAKYMGFAYNNVLIGTITQLTTTSVAYNTNSDYRLKSNVTPLSNSISRLQQLKPVSYTWTADNIDDIGFIAHEFKEVFPLNVTGEKDEVDEEGKPKYQQMSPNVCIPLLVSCVQEQQTEITYLKTQLASNSTRIETLEAQLSQVLQRLAAANIA